MHLIVGLGNPGLRYVDTRHNVGFLVVDTLARRHMATVSKQQHGALTGDARFGTHKVHLVKPQSFMNRSGGPVGQMASFYKVAPDQIIVVHDELDLPFGTVRIKKGGGHGGHNGLRDIQAKLGTRDFLRIRVGISRPPEGWDTANYVLGRWSTEEAASLPDVLSLAADVVEKVTDQGAEAAMNLFHAR